MKNDFMTKSFWLLASVLLAVIAWQSTRLVTSVDNLSTSLTGHLIQHGQTDVRNEMAYKSLSKLHRNQIRICTYEERTWADHERCER